MRSRLRTALFPERNTTCLFIEAFSKTYQSADDNVLGSCRFCLETIYIRDHFIKHKSLTGRESYLVMRMDT